MSNNLSELVTTRRKGSTRSDVINWSYDKETDKYINLYG